MQQTITMPDTEIDPEIAEQLGDEILANAAAGEKVQRVTGYSRSRGNARQSHTARAWTSGGNVD